jgi:hypothetical protein
MPIGEPAAHEVLRGPRETRRSRSNPNLSIHSYKLPLVVQPLKQSRLFRKSCGSRDYLSLWYLNCRGAACCALLGVRGLVGQGKPASTQLSAGFGRLRLRTELVEVTGPTPTSIMIPCTRFDMTRHASSHAEVPGVGRPTPGYPL